MKTISILGKAKPAGRMLGMLTVLAALASCSGGSEEAEELRLPISTNEVMASLINHSADPIWFASWRNPETDRDWHELEHLARQLQLGAALIKIPGTGPVDEMWTSRREWQEHADSLGGAAERAVNAARSKDVELILRSGNEIVDACESCHIEFKPGLPTMNIYGDLPERPADD